ncbi:MAG: SagB/ThcOx family dehydrogenase [Brevinematia bacterium]
MGRKVITFATILASLVLFSMFEHAWSKNTKLDSTGTSGIISLPAPRTIGKVSVEEAIKLRRSVRDYTKEALNLQEVSQLLWSAQGITDPITGFRSAPSAGATYPLEIYLIVGKEGVVGLEEGVYLYIPQGHKLKHLAKGDIRKELAISALGQAWVEKAPISIVITAIYERTTHRYGERGIRYVHMEVGHVGQNLHLQGVALGLGMVMVGAFYDEQVKKILQLPKEQHPLYIIPIGRPRSR